jgi:hypothetical protein
VSPPSFCVSSFYPWTHLTVVEVFLRAAPDPWILLPRCGLSPSVDSDWPIFMFPMLITLLVLCNFLFASFDISTLKMKVVGSSETLLNTSSITRHKISKDLDLY